MKAAVLNSLNTALVLEDRPDLQSSAGEVIVDIAAVGVLAYAGEVYRGERRYLMELPMVPGAGGIGRVRALGPDATRLQLGDWVYCDPTIRSRDDARSPDITLQGLTAGGPGALPLQRYLHDGSFAEQMRTATENVTRIGPIEPADAPRWCWMGTLLVPYGGFLAIGLAAGETVVINGATGRFGAGAVAVALAMGAAVVVAAGRNPSALAELHRRFGPRVRTATMTGDQGVDQALIRQVAAGPIDCVFDILPPAAHASQARAAILTVRPNGRVVLMGGVGMEGGDDLNLPYPWLMRNNITLRGQWMYPREAPERIAAMIRAGLIDLKHGDISIFPLEQINEAVAHAAANAGPFASTIVVPQQMA